MRKLQVVALCLLAACSYGVLHDQVTARVCVEYFTVAHPPLFHTTSPTLLALCWGIAATAGIGLALGTVLALILRPPYTIARLGREILALLGVMAASALGAGLAGYGLAREGVLALPESFAEAIPEGRHDRFMAVWFAHGASYAVGLVGGGILCWRVWRESGRPVVLSLVPRTLGGVLRALVVLAVATLILLIRFGVL